MTLLEKNIQYLIAINPGLPEVNEGSSIKELRQFAEQCNQSLENLMFFNLRVTDLPFQQLRFIFLDVDGVLTEGGMFYTEEKTEFKRFDTKDGMAIKEAMKHGIEFGIISSGVNEAIIRHRADMFGIKHVYVGAEPKLKVATKWLDALEMEWSNVGYIGDDINDLGMFEQAEIAACPSDATLPIKNAADLVLESKGGYGCVREFVRCIPQLKTIL